MFRIYSTKANKTGNRDREPIGLRSLCSSVGFSGRECIEAIPTLNECLISGALPFPLFVDWCWNPYSLFRQSRPHPIHRQIRRPARFNWKLIWTKRALWCITLRETGDLQEWFEPDPVGEIENQKTNDPCLHKNARRYSHVFCKSFVFPCYFSLCWPLMRGLWPN